MIHTLMILQGIVAILLILSVLFHFGKGAEAGLMGATDSMMSSAQRGDVLTKITTVLSIFFLAGALNLARLQSKKAASSIMDKESPIGLPLSKPKPSTK